MVVAPTVAAVGLAFFSYGFPVLGRCVEIGIPQIVVVVFFALVRVVKALASSSFIMAVQRLKGRGLMSCLSRVNVSLEKSVVVALQDNS